MKTLLTLAIAFALTAPLHADDRADATKAVDSFYASYVATIAKGKDGSKVVEKSAALSPGFKKAYAVLMADAKKKEGGLDYDPIVNGQDFPDSGYAVSSMTLKDATGSAVVSSRDKNFKNNIPIKLVKIDGTWLINGIDKLQGK
jgi:hypothetical protein